MIIIKRNGKKENFNAEKIRTAIKKANIGLSPNQQCDNDHIEMIISFIKSLKSEISVEQIQDIIETKLMESGLYDLAKKYIKYRYTRQQVREVNSTDDTILSLIRNENKELNEENSNKNPRISSTVRDYMAGIVSKDLSLRVLLPEYIAKAHNEGILHLHDLDYFVQNIPNCCLINIQDMLDNGTVMNKKMIESPKTFRVACTVLTQIIATIASNQYGGQSVDIKHLGKYLRRSYNKKYNSSLEQYKKRGFNEKDCHRYATEDAIKFRKEELAAGIQCIHYQINTLMTTNGQAPFVTIFMNLEKDDEYVEEVALIIQEILEQRIKGIKNEDGVYITPAFPKLVYVLHEHNCLKGGKYDYLTKIAAKCSAKRMYPDYISAKKMKENYEGNVFSCMGCRSFLLPYKDGNGNYKFEGRFNQGVVSINLPQIGLICNGDMDKFWKKLDDRLELCKEALLCRHKSLLSVTSDTSPLHWQHGGIARLNPGESIKPLLYGDYSTISLGYIGIYELTKLMIGESHTTNKGKDFAISVLKYMKEKCESWRKETNIGFSLYGTPAENLCYRFAEIDKKKFGEVKDVTDKGYYTNSYHMDVREPIDIFSKFKIESQFQSLSTGGCISYGEIPNMNHNIDAIEEIIRFIYDNIQYAEFNTKSDYCYICGFDGEMIINENLNWECPQCHNRDKNKMNVTRRTCGYLGENFWNIGKTKEINSRVLHL